MPNNGLRSTNALSFIIIAVLMFSTQGNSQTVSLPRISQQATVSQMIGISTVMVKYSRPSVKHRMIWGDLVPYGWNIQKGLGLENPAPWRAGADENTTITFSHQVKVEGIDIPAGTYGLFFIINEGNTGEVILSKNSTSWGSFFYDPGEDQLRANIKLREIQFTEMLTFEFINISNNAGELVLNWEKKQFPIKINFDVNEIVMANAKSELKGQMGFATSGYISAAYYSYQNNIDRDQGIMWIDKALEAEPTNYQAVWVKARFLIRDGKAEEAEMLIKSALEKSSETEMEGFGNMLLNLGITDRAIKVFLLYSERYPKSAISWYCLGEGYFNKGKKNDAIVVFRKSLSLNPTNDIKLKIENRLKTLLTQ